MTFKYTMKSHHGTAKFGYYPELHRRPNWKAANNNPPKKKIVTSTCSCSAAQAPRAGRSARRRRGSALPAREGRYIGSNERRELSRLGCGLEGSMNGVIVKLSMFNCGPWR
jgi:hypothetical protein